MMCYYLLILIILHSIVMKSNAAFQHLSPQLYVKSFQDLGATAFTAQEKVGRQIELNELEFHLYTSENRGQETLLDPWHPIELKNAPSKIYFLIHGWLESKKFNHWYDNLTNKLLGRYPDAKVIQLDWEAGSFQDFGISAHSTEQVGAHLATLIVNLAVSYEVLSENVVLIGNSLGAQICGWAGKHFLKYTTKRMGKIIALDPTGILFKNRPDSRRLNRNDAESVHVIHTDGNGLGTMNPCGTIDFYPNGGTDQPGCQQIDLKKPLRVLMDTVFCNHYRAFEYFVEAVGNPGSFLAAQCHSEFDMKRRTCDGNEVGMGYFDTSAEGIFYLSTNAQPPYSKLSSTD